MKGDSYNALNQENLPISLNKPALIYASAATVEEEQMLRLVSEVIIEEEWACPSSLEGGNRWKITSTREPAWCIYKAGLTGFRPVCDGDGGPRGMLHMRVIKSKSSNKQAGGLQGAGAIFRTESAANIFHFFFLHLRLEILFTISSFKIKSSSLYFFKECKSI